MSSSAAEHERRIPAFKAVCAHFGLEPQWSTAAAEDYHLTLEGEIELTRFVCVTRGCASADEIIYVAPAGDNCAIALEEALRHTNDLIYPEIPVAVVDLDTLRVLRPQWRQMPWETANDRITATKENACPTT